ncbi:DNA alkylation repair protein [Pseudonocardia dioxanivorans]|uniref:DNA alkylation repair protein n=1 Tax=Pseudonocardia dioxanivorans TaxID=240495 RepID=UPI001F186DD8|nr:DNA alkylation repair protein [Pseudonocardia dioxanivorans]
MQRVSSVRGRSVRHVTDAPVTATPTPAVPAPLAAAAAALVEAVRTGLAQLGDPVAAAAMQRYMKSEMPFHGVPAPARETLLRRLVDEHPLDGSGPGGGEVGAAADALWDGATRREERYLATGLVGHRRYARLVDVSWVPRLRHWIVTGAWWDHVDEIASRRVGALLCAHPAELTPVVRAWSTDPDPWLRRTSIICQLQAKGDTDLDLLTDAIEASIDDRDFFLRKGIGWALRQHARTDPGWVRAFVDAHPQLSPLSRREALKRL